MSNAISWPPGYAPSECPIHAINELDISASIANVWKLLVEAEAWSTYYSNASKVSVPNEQELRQGTQFTWQPAPATDMLLNTTVHDFEPQQRICWEAINGDAKADHIWILEETKAGRRKVHAEETQKGQFWVDVHENIPDALWQAHQNWVES